MLFGCLLLSVMLRFQFIIVQAQGKVIIVKRKALIEAWIEVVGKLCVSGET